MPAYAWPHNSDISVESSPAVFRTIFVSDEDEQADVYDRIEHSLRAARDWSVVEVRARTVAEAERALADSLASGPRRLP